jgi:hypothetical protein
MKCANWILPRASARRTLNSFGGITAMRLHHFSFLGFSAFGLSALALGLVSACAGGQTGDLSGEHSETGSTGCDEHKQKLAGFDEMTDAGSGEQLLAYAEKSFDAPITWKVAGAGQSWTVGPESGQGQIHIEVTRGQNAYQLTYSQKASQSGIEIGAICPPPQLAVDAHVNVSTAGGALAESYDTLLRSSTPGVATLSVPLDLSKLHGELAVSLSDPHAKLLQNSLDATLIAEGTTGRISGIEQVEYGSGPESSVSARPAVLAVWPDSAACTATSQNGDGLAAPVEQAILGATGDASIASVAVPTPAAISWMDGTQTTVTVAIEATGDGCFRVSEQPAELDGGPAVSYPVTISVKSADGRLDGKYPGQVSVTGSGSERRVTASAALQLSVDEAKKTGFASVEVPAGSDGLMLQVDSKLVQGVASGSVNLFAVSSPPCVTDPPPKNTPDSQGSASSPGCAGQSQTRLEAASW